MISPNLFSPKTLSFVNKIIGGFEVLSNKRVVISSLVASLDSNFDDLRIVNKSHESINPPEDSFTFFFLRAYCASLLSTGKIIREEKDYMSQSPPKFWGHRDVERYFYYGKDSTRDLEDVDKHPGKPMLVMSEQINGEEIKALSFYKNPAFHQMISYRPQLEKDLEDAAFRQFLQKYRISIIKDKITSFPEALDFLLEKNKYESVLVEAGTSLVGKYLEGTEVPSPFDLIVLTVYTGEVEQKWLGSPYPSMSKLLVNHKIVHESPTVPCEGGNLKFISLGKK